MKLYSPSDSKLISAAEHHLEQPTDVYDSSVSPTEGRPITTTTRPNRSDNQLTLSQSVHSLLAIVCQQAARHAMSKSTELTGCYARSPVMALLQSFV
jgi:hypothetical protein